MILSPEHIAYLRTRDGWLNAVRIADKQTLQLVTFRPNPAQHAIYAAMDRAEEEERAWFAIILKSRRVGCSTALQVEKVRRACTRRRFQGVTIAHKAESAEYLFGMGETVYQHLGDEIPSLMPPKKRGNVGRRLELASPLDSSLRVETAGDRDAGRATAAKFVHASEAAYWPDLAHTLDGIRQIVPDSAGSVFAIESTANGVGDAYHREVLRAQNGDSDYEFLFFPWFLDPACSRPGETPADLDEDEAALVAAGVSLEQLAWRRWAIRNLCGGSVDTFHQEYPSTPDEAFLTSGRLFFPANQIARLGVQPPKRVGSFDVDGTNAGRWVEDAKGPYRIWQAPEVGHSYLVSADTAGTVTEDEFDARPERDGEDYSSAYVLDLETGRVCCHLHLRCDPDVYALHLAKLGLVYHQAVVAVEAENQGHAVLSFLVKVHRYPRMHKRRSIDERTGKKSVKLGWSTNQATRALMLGTLKAWVRDCPERFVDEGFVREARTFVIHKNGKAAASSGCFDDRVMSLAIGVHLFGEYSVGRVVVPGAAE